LVKTVPDAQTTPDECVLSTVLTAYAGTQEKESNLYVVSVVGLVKIT